MRTTGQRQSAIKRLLGLVSQPTHDYSPGTDIFLELDVARLAAEMELARLGAERGAQGRPAPDAQTPDDVEHRVIERIESHKQDAHRLYLEHLHTYDQRIAALDFEERFAVIRQAAPEAVGDFRAEAALGRDELFALRRNVVGSEREREHFRKVHRLMRQARVPSTGSMILKIGILAVMFVIEVAVNGGFLAKSNPLGPLGGAVDAVTFAALNILASFLCGLVVIRLLNRRNILLKFFGLVGLAAYLAFAVGLNVVLAHLREIPPAASGDTGHEVLVRLIHAPFVFDDVMSWAFFCIGLIFSLVAMSDGILFTDPYPGYAGVEKRWLEADRKYRKGKSELVDRLRTIRDGAIDAMNGAARDLSVRRGEFDGILKGRSRLAQRFAEHQNHIGRTCNALLTVYREANRGARRDASVPKYFDKPYAIERIILAGDGSEETARERLRQPITESQQILESQIKAIHETFEAAATTYREMDELIPEEKSGQAAPQKG
jgi:hypothetical protein